MELPRSNSGPGQRAVKYIWIITKTTTCRNMANNKKGVLGQKKKDLSCNDWHADMAWAQKGEKKDICVSWNKAYFSVFLFKYSLNLRFWWMVTNKYISTHWFDCYMNEDGHGHFFHTRHGHYQQLCTCEVKAYNNSNDKSLLSGAILTY